ncbi:protein LTV1, partial [Lecanoromycetidae sp. Uapishka_2]
MPRKKAFDKSNSTTFQLVHRPQNDPKIHDASSSRVFQELAPPQSHKIKSRDDLESELFGSSCSTNRVLAGIRDNEGEAAEHGIYFDDTEYDYMQHIRDFDSGDGNGESYPVEAGARKKDGKGKMKMSLEDALREASIRENQSESDVTRSVSSQLLGDDSLPSKNLKDSTYQDQQDVPDVLAGFQPDMDPRLREVLEALEDEAYVDDEEDLFGAIARGGREITLQEFEGTDFQDGEDDVGWETDDTEKPHKEYNTGDMPSPPVPQSGDTIMEDTPDHGDGDWMKEFSKFKLAEKVKKVQPVASNAEIQSSVMTGTSMTGGRRKKRKGAKTSSTGYSMTSSSLFRTEGQTLLDARFDKIEEDYAEDEMDLDDGTASMATGTSLASSQAPQLTARSDFDSIMDDFLDGYSMSGKRRVKKGGNQSGLEQLDEVRQGLGPAKLRIQKAS